MTIAEVLIIKKYPNRRLYNTETSNYITLDNLYQIIKEGRDFVVQDAKTGEDLTRATLTQIIFEQESKGYSLLPISFLKQIIKLYDNNMAPVFTSHLEEMTKVFFQNIETWQKLQQEFTRNPMEQYINFYQDFYNNLMPKKDK